MTAQIGNPWLKLGCDGGGGIVPVQENAVEVVGLRIAIETAFNF